MAKIAARIRAGGPISIADYMAQCLLDPDHGYYATRDPFGAAGDFITAPEISQLFGEIIGVWLIYTWRQAGRPAPFTLCEMGPGRGTLMADVLRTARIDPDFAAAARPVLIEASARLRTVQSETLGDDARRVRWIDRLDQLDQAPLFLVANEFFDALPVRQFIKTDQGWHERVIGLTDTDALTFLVGPAILPRSQVPQGDDHAPDGTIFEIAPTREAVAAQIAEHLAQHGGLALAIDYGHHQTSVGDTLQAVKDHAFAHPLAEPGLADLTSHVDFAALAASAEKAGAQALPTITQSQFLLQNGIVERAGVLGAEKTPQEQDAIQSAIERLCGDKRDQMGQLFKVLALVGPALPRPIAPFEATG